jgi:pimeloyl-ACP methyl ester carboxylesterase
MTKFIILFLVFFCLFSCKKENDINTEDTYEYTGALGDIINIVREDSLSPSQIQASLPAQISAFITAKYGVRIYNIEYKSLNKDADTVKASGVIFVPMVDSFSLPLVSYQHGTVLKKTDVPSLNIRSAEYLINLASASGSGVVACLPDYLGLGTGDGFHLYLNPTEEANSVRDMLRAARKLAKQKSIAQLNGQVFLFGYSQGGHATMATQRELEKDNIKEFKLTACAPMAGSYAASRTSQFDVILDSVYYPTPFYLPYVLVSLINTFPLYSSYSQIIKPPYDTRIPIVMDGSFSNSYANAQFPNYISTIIIDSVRNAIRNDPNHPIRLALRAYDLVDDWTPKAPMKLYHCSGDDNVFFANAVYADSVFKSRGANVELVDLGDANHIDCAPLGILYAKLWFDDLLKLQKIK